MKEGFTFEAALDSLNQNIQFTFTFPKSYYISIGFGYTMQDAPMVVVFDEEADGQTTPIIKDVFSLGHHKPKDNNQNVYRMVDAQLDNEVWTATIERPVSVQREGRDESIQLDETLGMQWAYHKDVWKKHTKFERGVFNMKIDSITGASTFNNLVLKRDVFYLAHGIIFYIAWSILTFLLIVSGRYMKHLYNFRMIIHIWLCLFVAISTVAMVLCSLFIYPSYTLVRYNHLPVGIAVGAITILQTVGGFGAHMFNQKSGWKTNSATYSKIFHKLLGYVIIILSNYEVVTGMYCYKSPIWKLIFVHFGVMVFCLLLFELIHRKKSGYGGKGKLKKTNIPKYTKSEFDELVEEGRKVVLFNNFVIDWNTFIGKHPGTSFSISESIGTDIGKFFFGTAQINQELPKYNHSNFAVQILEKLTIGKIWIDSEKSIEYSAKTEEGELIYSVSNQTKISEAVSIVTLELPRFENKISRRHPINALEYAGMGYLIKSGKNNWARYYTICDCMRSNVYHNYLKIFDNILNDDPIEEENTKIGDLVKDNLQFVIKQYADTKSGMSVQLANAMPFDKFYVNGPVGKPLDFTPENTEGLNMIFWGGTGILPFMDLFAYLGRKQLARNGLFTQEDFHEIGPKAHFLIYAYFPTREDCVGIELVEAVEKLYHKNEIGFKFKLNLVLTRDGGERFNDEELIELLQDYSMANQRINRLMVCGPPPMNTQFQKLSSEIIEKTGINKCHFDIL